MKKMESRVREFIQSYSGYNGGDIGEPDRRSIWCCGIEWGGSTDVESIARYYHSGEWREISGFEDKNENCTAPYDKVLCKVLCAMAGKSVDDYEQFAWEQRVWHKGVKSGYFKMNLYPLWFKDTDSAHWTPELTSLLGFADKNEYLRYCHKYRFPAINQLMQKHQPKAVLCFGTTYEDEFNLAFSDGYKSFCLEIIDNLPVKWKRNENGIVVAVIPFPNAPRYGLQRNRSMQLIGEFLAKLID